MTWHNTIELSTGLWKFHSAQRRSLLTPCWKWQIYRFQPAPTIITPCSCTQTTRLLSHTPAAQHNQPGLASSELSARRCWQSKESTDVMISEESYKLGVTSNRACTRGSPCCKRLMPLCLNAAISGLLWSGHCEMSRNTKSDGHLYNTTLTPDLSHRSLNARRSSNTFLLSKIERCFEIW